MKSSPRKRLLPLLLGASFGAFVLVTAASGTERGLPADPGVYLASNLPGYTSTLTYCLTCHSTEYVRYQPPSARAYWQATVVKMQKTFGAPIPDSEISPIVEYLAKVYGTEKAPASVTARSTSR